MNALRRLSPALAALLLAFVLAGRLVVPTGWMPTVGSHGIEVRLCTGQGSATMLLHLGEESPDEPRDPCPFALLAQAFPLPGAPAVEPVLAAPVAAPIAWPQARARLAPAPHALPPPTGPPAFA